MGDDVLHAAVGDRVQKTNGGISGSSGANAPNPRSCVTCRKRKVKCDKKQPCSNCVRAKIECIFPGPGRAPRKSRKPPDGELMDRLKRLEGVVQSLNAQVEEHEQEAAEREKRENSSSTEPGCQGEPRENHRVVATDNSVQGLETRFGRLVVDQGRSRYVNNSFWASLNNEVEDLKSILIDQSDDEEDHSSADSSSQSQHQSFIFGYSSSNVDMAALHPTPERALEYWAIFKENVDLLVKVLHTPTFEPVLLDAIAHPEKMTKSLEPLVFAIYYGAVTSVMPDECMERWGEDRKTLLARFRFGLEQGLARANFLFCDEVIILQALVIFLILLRRNDDARKIWTLTGLAVRIAQTLGIHRDGSHFTLCPFEIEMRRRLWWQVCILDARSSEDHGCDPTIVEAQFDTKMPLNVNDADLDPKMTEMPEERKGFTDMTFCLIRFEVTNIFRRILYVPPGNARCTEFFANLTIPEKEKWISDCHQRLEDKYLKDCDMSIPLCWVTATVSRLIMSKMWLVVYHPHQRRDGGASLPQETKDKLFITSLENIEYSILLETEARTMKWGWLFRTYVQWHAIAFLLSELCVRTKGEAVDRAWRALEATAGRWWYPLQDSSPFSRGQAGCLWKPLRKLMAKARAAREKELALERASQAIKSGNAHYANFSIMLDSMGDGRTIDQPNPNNLDSMLRPAAPKLGEIPGASPPTLNGSPSVSPTTAADQAFPEPMGAIPKYNAVVSSTAGNMGSGTANDNNKVNSYDFLSHGLDFVIHDVMEGYRLDGTRLDDATANTAQTSAPAQATDTNGLDAFGIPNNKGTTNGFNQNFNLGFGNPFEQSPPALVNSLNDNPVGVAAGNGPNLESPLLDGGNMDWEVWDDLVTQYGMEGPVPQTTANGAGHLGMMNWF